jgi:hypothetical protein
MFYVRATCFDAVLQVLMYMLHVSMYVPHVLCICYMFRRSTTCFDVMLHVSIYDKATMINRNTKHFITKQWNVLMNRRALCRLCSNIFVFYCKTAGSIPDGGHWDFV